MSPLRPNNNPVKNYKSRSHPKALALLNAEIFWSPGDESGPTRGDVGSDALHDFWEWRPYNRSNCVYEFLHDQLLTYGFTSDRITAVANNVVSLAINEFHYDANTYDDYTIALAFAQFMAEGCVDARLLNAAFRSITRQTDSLVIEFRGGDSMDKEGLKKVSDALKKMDTCKLSS